LKLTPSEIELADKLIAGLEKRSHLWKRVRWLILLVGIACVILAILVCWHLDHMSIQNLEDWVIEGEDLRGERIKTYVELKIFFLRKTFTIFVQAVVMVGAGGLLLVTSLMNWNRHLRDALVAKVLRAKLESECGFTDAQRQAADTTAPEEARDLHGSVDDSGDSAS
jgi:hypothetical protein